MLNSQYLSWDVFLTLGMEIWALLDMGHRNTILGEYPCYVCTFKLQKWMLLDQMYILGSLRPSRSRSSPRKWRYDIIRFR